MVQRFRPPNLQPSGGLRGSAWRAWWVFMAEQLQRSLTLPHSERSAGVGRCQGNSACVTVMCQAVCGWSSRFRPLSFTKSDFLCFSIPRFWTFWTLTGQFVSTWLSQNQSPNQCGPAGLVWRNLGQTHRARPWTHCVPLETPLAIQRIFKGRTTWFNLHRL